MKKPNPQIITEFLDAFIASGQSKLLVKDIVKQTGIPSHNVTCIFQYLKNSSKYHITPHSVTNNITTYNVAYPTKTMQLTNSVVASTNIIKAWRKIANNPDQRLYIPAFWPALNR
jgi:hypothetical protein